MKLHHSKHHATYVNNLNVAEEKLSEAQAEGNLQKSFATHVWLSVQDKLANSSYSHNSLALTTEYRLFLKRLFSDN